MNQIICKPCSFRTFSNSIKLITSCNTISKRFQTTGNANRLKVTILGAAGNLGKGVALMLKQSPYIDELCLYDLKSPSNFARDLNFIDTKCRVSSFCGEGNIQSALQHSNVIVITASVPGVDNTDYKGTFEKNACIMKELATNIAKFAPKAFVAINTEPINSTVPMFSEIMKRHGYYNPAAIFGITTIDVVRANKFVAEVLGLEPECVIVPIVGGHTEKTIVPVLSQTIPCNEFTNDELEDITMSVRLASDNLARARVTDNASLSTSFATARFVISLVKAIRGHKEVIECAYVKSDAHPQVKYMVTPLLLGPGGVARNLGIPDLTDYETCLLENAIPIICEDIKKGEIKGGRADVMLHGKLQEPPLCNVCDPDPKVACPPDHCAQKISLADK